MTGYNGAGAPHLQDLAAELRKQFRNSKAGFNDKVDGFAFDGHYYARNIEGAFVDEHGKSLNLDKLLRKPGEEPQFDLGEWDFGAANIVAAELPPRGWLLGNWLCRQFVSALIADGAAGKTAVRLACALSLATGRELLKEHVFERVPVLFVCFEDGETELKRRICSAMLKYGISNADITGYLFVRAITAGEMKLAIANDFNKAERGPLIAALDAAIIRRKVGAVFLDPLVKTHAVNENSNKDMDLVIEILADLAISCDIAVDTPHHVSKGAAEPGNADRGRGASAVKDGGRLIYTLSGMSAKEALFYGLDNDARLELVRIDQGKVNITRRTSQAKWLRLVGVPLGNTFDPRYPKGDNVQTVEPWTPPDTFAGLPRRQLAVIFTALRGEPKPGEFYSPHATAPSRWVGNLIIEHAGKTPEEAKYMTKAWLESGVLIKGTYSSLSRKTDAWRVTLNEIKVAEILGPLYQPPSKAEVPPPPKAPKAGSPASRNKHDVLDQIYAAIDRGVPPNDDGAVRYYSAEATSERAAWRVVVRHRPELNSNDAQAMVTKWVRNGIFVPIEDEDGVRLSPIVKLARGI